jgi:tetratricopeptide (TPR) repeat protein
MRAHPAGRGPMNRPAAANGHRQTDDLLARLGLPPSASPEDVEAAHRAVVEYLASAPSAIRGWAHGQAAAADEALLLLTDPGSATGPALRDASRRPAVSPGGPATPPARRAAPPPAALARELEDTASTADEELTEEERRLELLASVTPSLHRDTVPSAPGSRRATRGRAVPRQGAAGGWLRRAGIAAVFALGGAGLAFAGYNAGGGGGVPAITSSPTDGAVASGPTLDEERVASLMAQIQANPEDVGALLSLADEFYIVGQWQTAATWLDKALAIEPQNVRALLAKGATAWNLRDPATAETIWLSVVALDPNNVEAHYDLGFLYLNREPSDMEGVQREWTKVIELDPNSALAQNVKTHLDALLPSASPGTSPAPSEPAPSAAPASAAPSAEPGSPEPGASSPAAPAASASPAP